MKNSEIAVLDEKESKLVQMLENFGLSGASSRVIICLTVCANSTIREIGVATGLSSAAVSMTLKKLRADGIVGVDRPMDKPHKRDVAKYHLTGDMNHVLAIIEEKKRKEVSRYIEKTTMIKNQVMGHLSPQTRYT